MKTFLLLLLSVTIAFGQAGNIGSGVTMTSQPIITVGGVATTNEVLAAGSGVTMTRAAGTNTVAAMAITNGLLHLQYQEALGATDSNIARFKNVIFNQGEGVHWLYATNAANASRITIIASGVYAVSFGIDSPNGAAATGGVSIDSTQLTTTYYSINPTNMMTPPAYTATATECIAPAVGTRYILSNSVLRAHTDAATPASPGNVHFFLQRIN